MGVQKLSKIPHGVVAAFNVDNNAANHFAAVLYDAEDPRVFRWGKGYAMAYASHSASENSTISQTFARLHQNFSSTELRYAKQNTREKNWLPWMFNGTMYVLYSI